MEGVARKRHIATQRKKYLRIPPPSGAGRIGKCFHVDGTILWRVTHPLKTLKLVKFSASKKWLEMQKSCWFVRCQYDRWTKWPLSTLQDVEKSNYGIYSLNCCTGCPFIFLLFTWIWIQFYSEQLCVHLFNPERGTFGIYANHIIYLSRLDVAMA